MRRMIPLVVALVAMLAAAASASASPVIGVADQKPDLFADPRFAALGLHYVRYAVPWDVMRVPWERQEATQWLDAARAAGARPLISFDHSRLARLRHYAPSVREYTAQVAAFHRRFGWVQDFATWNEANLCGEPVCHRPALVAGYYQALRRLCPACDVLAAEVLDVSTMVPWVRAFQRYARRPSAAWGLHDYSDVNRLQTRGTRALLSVTHGQVWLTEVGGLVSRHNHSRVNFTESAPHAALATRWLFAHVAPLSPRIRRVYVYSWNATRGRSHWDSALIGPDGRARPAFAVFAAAVRAAGAG